MKNILNNCMFLLVLSIASNCRQEDEISYQIQPCENPGTAIETVINKRGEIFKIGERWLISITINEKNVGCLPCNLPDELKIENKIVRLDADFYSIPPNARLIGEPIEILRIYDE